MAGSHEVRGSIPLGSTTDTRGARRRRRAPLFLLPGTEKKARGARLLLGVAAGRLALARLPWSLLVSFGGVGAGRRPFLVRPDSPAPFERPGGKRVPAAHGHREAGALAPARPAREEAAPDLFGRIEAICSRAGTHSALGCMGPAEFGNAGLSPWKTLSWPSRIRRRLGRALLPGDLGGAVAVGAAAPDL